MQGKGGVQYMAVRHPKTQARRAELLRAAREVLAEKGFDATTVSEIVARAGVAQGTFYLYFPSKLAVVRTLVDELWLRIEQALRSTYAEVSDLGEMIERSVEAAFHIMGEYSDVLALTHSGIRWLGVDEASSPVFAPYHALIAETIHSAQAAGAIDAAIDPDVTAIFIVGTIYYAADQCYVYHSSITPDVYIAEAARFIRRSLGIQ